MDEIDISNDIMHLTLIRINDIGENFIARKLIQKFREDGTPVQINILDVIAFETSSLSELSNSLKEVTLALQDTDLVNVAANISHASGIAVNGALEKVSAVDFYNTWLQTKLDCLKDGDGEFTHPFLSSIEINTTHPLWEFSVSFRLPDAIEMQKRNLAVSRELGSKMMLTIAEKNLGKVVPAVGFPFMIKRIMQIIKKFHEEFGNDICIISTTNFQFRHLLVESEKDGRILRSPSPMSIKSSTKPELMFHIEAAGLVDILEFKIHNPKNINDIEVYYIFRYPPMANMFLNKLYGISKEELAKLSEIQRSIHQRTYRFLEEKLIFDDRPQLVKSWVDLYQWLLNKVSFNLNDVDFLSKKFAKWRKENPKDGLVEDNFFLPFLYEKMSEKFEDRIVKKPEMFGGELDLLFDNIIPIELKVRKGAATPFSELIDEHYKAHEQARAYAAKSRLAIVCVLDIPEKRDATTNLDNSIMHFAMNFGEGPFDTVVITCIFPIRLKSPSQ